MKRPLLAALSVLLVLVFATAPSDAASKGKADQSPVTLELSGNETADVIKRAVDGLARTGHPVTLRIGGQSGGQATTPAGSEPPAEGLAAAWDSLVAGVVLGAEAIAEIPARLREWQPAWSKVVNASSAAEAGFKSGLILLVAIVSAIVLRGIANRLLPLVALPPDAPFLSRLRSSARQLLKNAAAVICFVLVAWLLAAQLLPVQDHLRKVLTIVVEHIAVAAIYVISGRFLLSPGNPNARLVPIAHADWQARMILVYGTLAALLLATVKIAGIVVADPRFSEGWFALTVTIATIFKLWWFWTSRHDVERLVLDGASDPQAPTALRRLAAVGMPLVLMFSAAAIWAIGRMAAVGAGGEQLAGAAGLTQFLIIVVPVLATGARKAARELLNGNSEGDTRHPVFAAAMYVAERSAGWFVWIVGLLMAAEVWGIRTADTEASALVALLNRAAMAAAIMFAGYVVLAFVRRLLDLQTPKPRSAVPSAEEEVEVTVQSRLASVMPVLRGFVLGAVIALTALIALSKLGIDTGPLLAGFGILGLAVSFGSQALVRDVVSGAFFMTEDAFRVGEYIDTGKLKGTVEKINLRSVQLRHQSGLVHTVPFGQIASVTNASRDWATVKFNIRIDRRSDIEKVRKAVKKVGQEMQADPEFASELILPLKMQGVSDIVDNAIICRLKFTSKPARASWVQRELLKRVYHSLREAGIEFAQNAVMVQSTDRFSAAGAGAAVRLAETQQRLNAEAVP